MKRKLIGILLIGLAVLFAYSGFISDAEYSTLGGILFFLVLAYFGLRKPGVIGKGKKPVEAKAVPQNQYVLIHPTPSAPAPSPQPLPVQPVPEASPKPKTVYAPDRIGDCQSTYEYHKVNVHPMNGLDINALELGSKVSFVMGKGTPAVMLDGRQIGTMLAGRMADMVSDWVKRGEPIFSVLETIIPDENLIQLFVVFYRNLIEVAERRGLSRVKLVSNGNQDMQESISCQEIGDPCYVMYDSDKEKWEVNASSGTIGYLPAKYKDDTISEEAKVIIADIEENDETGKSSVWVYVI